MKRTEQLHEILNQMETCDNEGDVEGSHMQADDLLLRTISCLARGADEKELASEIDKTFTNLSKWYA